MYWLTRRASDALLKRLKAVVAHRLVLGSPGGTCESLTISDVHGIIIINKC